MNKLLLLFGLIGGAALLASCARFADQEPPFVVDIKGDDDTCHITVAGERVSSDRLLEMARQASNRRGIIVFPRAAPYRCVGGVVYTLERAGMVSVKAVPRKES